MIILFMEAFYQSGRFTVAVKHLLETVKIAVKIKGFTLVINEREYKSETGVRNSSGNLEKSGRNQS